MFAKEPFPKTRSALCDSYLRSLVDAVESKTLFKQTEAKGWLDKLYSRKCQINLNWFCRNYGDHPDLFVQTLVNKAGEYAQSIKP